MALGDPLQTMTLSRLPSPQETLAGVGVVKAIAVFLESPIIMILHASTALSKQKKSRETLWRFMLLLSAILTGILLVLTQDPIYTWLFLDVFGTTQEIANIAHVTLAFMILWPASIAWRRYFQGLLIRNGNSRYVGYASFGRFGWVVLSLAVGLYWGWNGAWLAGFTMIGGVVLEALLVTIFAKFLNVQQQIDSLQISEDLGLPTTVQGVTKFYAPLASTMLIVWGGRAILVSLVARSSDGALALAAWPAAWGFVLSVANATRMVQQVIISTADKYTQHDLFRFVFSVGVACSLVLFFLGFTETGLSLFAHFLGNKLEIVSAATPVLKIAVFFPLLLALQNAMQGFLILRKKNGYINITTALGVFMSLSIAGVLIFNRFSGSVSAAWGMTIGTSLEILLLSLFLGAKHKLKNR